jgi:predicted ATPase
VLVGRSDEWSRLSRVLAEAKDGRSRSVVVRGEAGIDGVGPLFLRWVE